jgi:hypothetical protein
MPKCGKIQEDGQETKKLKLFIWQEFRLRLHFWQMSQTITVRLNKQLSSWLEEKASRTGLSQSQIVREQLKRAKAAKVERPLLRSAGSVHGLPRKLSSRKGFSRS